MERFCQPNRSSFPPVSAVSSDQGVTMLPLAFCPHGTLAGHYTRLQQGNIPWWKAWTKKYVVLCLICGGASVLLGIILICIYFILRSYTSSLQFFETIPTYVPAVVLIVTGIIVMCFAKRKNRYAYLIKLAGGCCLICALLCVVITVTTTVVHMNRLQTLHECVYNPNVKTCMCVSATADPNTQDGAHRFIFNNTPSCEVVHGSLYACLRALFGLSVTGILVCIFSSMLVYQLLSHEKKKLYWEQLELRRRFLYRRQSHHTCGCYEDLYSWQLWEMVDYRLLNPRYLASSPVGEEEESRNLVSAPSVRGVSFGGGNHQASGWSWLPWPWQDTVNHNVMPARASVNNTRYNLMRRLISRSIWEQQAVTPSPNTPQESSVQNGSPNYPPWHNDCMHVLQSNLRNGNDVSQVRFGIRSRNSAYGRAPTGHRRTRSNDGIFHHLHMNTTPLFTQSYPVQDGSGVVSCHLNYEVPRYMWGPPPPYSQPTSLENISTLESGNDGQEIITNRDCSNNRRLDEQLNRIGNIEIESVGTPLSSKRVNSLREHKLMCHNFSNDAITITIGNNSSTVCNQNGNYNSDERKREETCVVEVHVPYLIHKSDVVFNTLPARSSKKKHHNPFKSLSNIPLCFSKKLNGLRNDKNLSCNLAVIEKCCELKEALNHSINSKCIRDRKNILCDAFSLKTLSEQHLCEDKSTNTSISEASPSSLSFHPTIVEIPSDFKSSVIIATSPSTPVTENITLPNIIYAQSMPNLSLSNSLTMCSVHRTPSSGNTSTSQDFADFELDEDSSPIELGSPIKDFSQFSDGISHCNGSQLLPCAHYVDGYFDRSDSSSGSYGPPCGIIKCLDDRPFSVNNLPSPIPSDDGTNEDKHSDIFLSDSSNKEKLCAPPIQFSNTPNNVSQGESLKESPTIMCNAGTQCDLNSPSELDCFYMATTIRGRNLIPLPHSDKSENFVVTVKGVNV